MHLSHGPYWRDCDLPKYRSTSQVRNFSLKFWNFCLALKLSSYAQKWLNVFFPKIGVAKERRLDSNWSFSLFYSNSSTHLRSTQPISLRIRLNPILQSASPSFKVDLPAAFPQNSHSRSFMWFFKEFLIKFSSLFFHVELSSFFFHQKSPSYSSK